MIWLRERKRGGMERRSGVSIGEGWLGEGGE
jgi:hypothetical protein